MELATTYSILQFKSFKSIKLLEFFVAFSEKHSIVEYHSIWGVFGNHIFPLNYWLLLSLWIRIFKWSTIISPHKDRPAAQLLHILLSCLSPSPTGILSLWEASILSTSVDGATCSYLPFRRRSFTLSFCADSGICSFQQGVHSTFFRIWHHENCWSCYSYFTTRDTMFKSIKWILLCWWYLTGHNCTVFCLVLLSAASDSSLDQHENEMERFYMHNRVDDISNALADVGIPARVQGKECLHTVMGSKLVVLGGKHICAAHNYPVSQVLTNLHAIGNF